MLDILFVALFQVAAGPVEDATATTPAPATSQATEIDPLDVVQCERVRPPGSRMATERVCMTERERQRLRSENAHNMRESASRSGASTQPDRWSSIQQSCGAGGC